MEKGWKQGERKRRNNREKDGRQRKGEGNKIKKAKEGRERKKKGKRTEVHNQLCRPTTFEHIFSREVN